MATPWERQERVLLEHGYRCISYDRRGFGRSSQPTTGYDYDTFAGDLSALLDHLALDQEVVLAGFSMGTGEVTRYLGKYGSGNVSKAILLGVIPPFLLHTDDNPKGVPGSVFEGIKQAIAADRYACFEAFFADFYNTDKLAPERIGEAALHASFNVAAAASPYASYVCVDTWLTGLSRGSAQDRRADAGRSRHRRASPPLRGDRRATQGRALDRGSHGRRGRERTAQHRLDVSPRRSMPRSWAS